MEGFVNTNFNTFNNGLRHSNNFVNYGVDKIDKQDQSKNDAPQSSTKLLTVPNDFYLGNLTNNIVDIDKVVVDTVTTPNQDRHQRLKTAGVIGGSGLVIGGLTLVLTKGKISKKVIKSLGKIIDNADAKIVELTQKPTKSHIEAINLKMLQKTNDIASRIRGAFFNITPLKDVLFARIVKQYLGLKKPCNAITNGFRKLSFSTVKSAYSKAGAQVDYLTNLFSETNVRLASGEFVKTHKRPPDKIIKTMNDSVNTIRNEFISGFSRSQLEERNRLLINKFSGLDKRVYNSIYGKIKEFVTDIDEWTTFVPERIVANDKVKIINELSSKKKVITNNPRDNYNKMADILNKLENIINPNDKDSRNTVKNLKALADKYVNLSGANEQNYRNDVIKRINSHLHRAIKFSLNETYTPSETKKITALLRQFGAVVNTDKKGAIEELLTMYKEYVPDYEYQILKAEADKTIKLINKAVNKEGTEYVDKARDLACGSALTDVAIGMSLPLVTTSLAMSAAKTKEKKRSVVLKYGLPLLAGVSASTIATVKLISGGKSLMLGSAVSILSNELFERLDNYLISRDKKLCLNTETQTNNS